MTEKNVLITGASRGLGIELQKTYADDSWRTFPLVRQASVADELTRQYPDRCHPIVSDLTDDQVANDIQSVMAERADHLDLLINNAGFAGRTYKLDELTSGEIVDLFQVHCLGAFRSIKAVLPFLRKAQGAKIVNITSRLGSIARNASGEYAGKPFTYSYRMSKAAQNMMTLCLSQELVHEGISVYGIHPGRLLTDSASYDADTPPDVAARRIADLVDTLTLDQTGRCFDPANGEIPW